MKHLTSAFLAVSCGLLLASSGVVPPGDWLAEGYQYNMTFYAQVLRPDGTYVDNEKSVLAVFDASGECRGAISPIEGPNGWLYQLSIASNNTAEQGLAFKILDAVTGETYPITETVDFANDAIVPEDGIVHPQQLHIPPGCLTLQLQPGWNLVAFPFVPQPEDANELLGLQPFEIKDGVAFRATALEANRGYWFYASRRTTIVLAPGEAAPEPELPSSWGLIGATGAAPSWLSQVALPFFRWDATRGFVPAATPEAGKGYWVKKQ